MMDPITAAAVRPILAIAKRALRPVLNELEDKLRKKAKVCFDTLFDGYGDYLSRSYIRYSRFVSLAFRDEQRQLLEMYLPLTLVPASGTPETKIDSFPSTLLSESKKILIVDTAGMGKTTILKYIFLQCIQEKKAIPVYIDLRRLSKRLSLLDYIRNELSSLDENNQKRDMLIRFLRSGKFLILLDGYDEIAEQERPEVTQGIIDFIGHAEHNCFMMASRSEIGLASFAAFRKLLIRPLNRGEAYTLIRKYDSIGIAEALIAYIQHDKTHGIDEFLTNPLMISLLYRCYEYKQTIPVKRHNFYAQVFEALYESHDLAKDGGEFIRKKRSGLDLDRFEKFLRFLAAHTYRRGVIETTRNGWVNHIEDCKEATGEKRLSPTAFIHDITHAVPLMILEGTRYRWTHRSIQEYFAACNICYDQNGRSIDIFSKLYNSVAFDQHINLISIASTIDAFVFKSAVGFTLATQLLDSFSSVIPEISTSAPESYTLRRSLTAGRQIYAIPSSLGVPLTPGNAPDAFIDPLRAHLGISLDYEIRVFAGSPLLVEIETPISKRIDALASQVDLPFIVPNAQTAYTTKEFTHWDIPQIQNINTILDSHTQFEEINRRLQIALPFKFDADIAREYLSDLSEEQAARRSSTW